MSATCASTTSAEPASARSSPIRLQMSLWPVAGCQGGEAQDNRLALMPRRAEIVTFDDSPPPPGADPWVVPSAAPRTGIAVTDPDPAWPLRYDDLAGRIREALGWRVLQLEHVGSTAVPGLAAKPVIDIDLAVADPEREHDYVPALESIGFRLTIREPWWYGHRMLRADEPFCNLHVFGIDSPELVRHRIFRDWLRGNPGDRDHYAAAKRQAAAAANAGAEHVMQYNARKQQVIREIYHRAFVAAGLLEE
jgi:GrpB-like predicted nucleotidyltransferase (UPF0157 family)